MKSVTASLNNWRMILLKRLRPFLFTTLIILFVVVLLILLSPASLIVRITPAQSTEPHQIPMSNRVNPKLGRQDVLFHLNSQIQGEVSVQQFVHYYFRQETAVSNFNQNFGGNPDWFPNGAEAYRVNLPERGFPEKLLCYEQAPDRLLCEYRAQMGHWTLHTDFASRNTAVYDLEVVLEMVGIDW